jgi:phosphoglycolate phosphatase
MIASIFIDFDGTIVDVWRRYYTVFSDIVKYAPIDFDQYKALRNKRYSDLDVAKKFQIILPSDFRIVKLKMLEEERYLHFDNLLISPKIFTSFVISNNAIILTKRIDKTMFFRQLAWLGLGTLENNSVVLGSGIEKKDWIKNHFAGKRIVMIGDSDKDAEVGQLQDALAVIVNTGFGVSNELTEKSNTTKVDDINKAIDFIMELAL